MKNLVTAGLLLSALSLMGLACAASAQDSFGNAGQRPPSLSDFSLLQSPQGAAAAPNRGPRTLDKIVAVVGDDVVLESELDSAVNEVRAQAGARVRGVPPNVLRSQILDQLIMTKLQVQRADQRNVKVSNADVDDGLARIAQQNNMTMAQLTRAVASDGMDMQQLRSRIRQQLLVSKLRQQEVMAKVVITNDDVDRYLQNQSLRDGRNPLDSGPKVMVSEVKARHILLKPNEIRGDQRTRKLARQIRARLEAGDDFAALARKYSDDSATANQGGDLGWVQPSRLDPATQRQIASVTKGQISPIFETGEGYELLKVEDRRQRDQTTEAIRNRARMALGKQKSSEQGELWLRKLRDEAYVDIRMANYRPTGGG